MASKSKRTEIRRILAMDLSMSLPAFAVMDVANGKALVKEIRYTNNKEMSKISHGERLNRIAETMIEIFKDYPDIEVVVREKGFHRFATTTQILFKVVGVSDLMVYQGSGITKIDEIPPTTVKRIVAGDGRADKKDVEDGVREHLVDLQKDMVFDTDDCSDAVAVGIAWFLKNGYLI